MAKKKVAVTLLQTKNQLKKELANKIESALPEIKLSLGEKKFNKRLKKITRLLTDGLNLNGKIKATNKKIFSTNGLNANNTVADAVNV